MEFQSTHKLDFLCAPWNNPFNTQGWQLFKIGTCNGQWRATLTTYDILSVLNDQPGNGHFQDVLEWFENSCKRDKKDLRILELMNKELENHLIVEKGFTVISGTSDLIKKFTNGAVHSSVEKPK